MSSGISYSGVNIVLFTLGAFIGDPFVFDTLADYSGYAQLVFARRSSVTGHSFISLPVHLISLLPRAQKNGD